MNIEGSFLWRGITSGFWSEEDNTRVVIDLILCGPEHKDRNESAQETRNEVFSPSEWPLTF